MPRLDIHFLCTLSVEILHTVESALYYIELNIVFDWSSTNIIAYSVRE